MDREIKQRAQQEKKPQEIKQKQPTKKQANNDAQDIDNLINQFQQQDHLNLTDEGIEQQQEDAQAMKKVKQQYQKFMKQLGNEGEADMGISNLGKAFEDLLKGLGEDDGKSGQQLGKKFQEMFKNLDNPQNFQTAAQNLLNQFMDKSLLEQPLNQTKQNYQKYFQQFQGKKLTVQEEAKMKNYKSQLDVIQKLLDTIKQQQSSDKKKRMIELFSQLQNLGDPPEGIAPSYGFF